MKEHFKSTWEGKCLKVMEKLDKTLRKWPGGKLDNGGRVVWVGQVKYPTRVDIGDSSNPSLGPGGLGSIKFWNARGYWIIIVKESIWQGPNGQYECNRVYVILRIFTFENVYVSSWNSATPINPSLQYKIWPVRPVQPVGPPCSSPGYKNPTQTGQIVKLTWRLLIQLRLLVKNIGQCHK